MKRLTLYFFLSVSTCVLMAQTITTTSGGNITNSNGNVSYSVGQVFYNIESNSKGYLKEGVLQPFLIETASNFKEEYKIDLGYEINTYPNPTSNYLNLSIEAINDTQLSFQLLSIEGQLLESSEINSQNTTINMTSYKASVYFLKISTTNNGQIIKTFKIVKN